MQLSATFKGYCQGNNNARVGALRRYAASRVKSEECEKVLRKFLLQKSVATSRVSLQTENEEKESLGGLFEVEVGFN